MCVSFLLPYLALTVPQIHRLGIGSTEAMVALAATAQQRAVSWESVHFSPQLAEYHGSLESVIALPALLLFGYTSAILRLTMIFWGAATLLAVFFLARELFRDSTAAWCAAWMLATLPAFVSGTYFGIHHASLMLFFQASGSAALLRWARDGRDRYLHLGFFLFGCGLACRLWFTAVLAATAAAGLLLLVAGVFPPRDAQRAGFNRRRALTALICFFVGALPLVLVILNNGVSYYWATLREILISTTHATTHIPRNYIESLSMRLDAARRLLTDDWLLRDPFPDMNYSAPLVVQAMLCAFCWLPLSCLLKGGPISVPRRLLFPAYIVVCFAVLSISGHYETNHQLILLPPLILMTTAAAADLSGRLVDKRRSAALLVFMALAWPAVTRPWQLQRDLGTMTDSPPEYTDAIPAASRWLDANAPPGPLLVDAGMAYQLQFFLARRYELISIPNLGSSFPDSAKHAAFYIAFHPDQIPKLDPQYPQWRRLAMERLGDRAQVMGRFNDRGGKPMILIYRLPRPHPDLNRIIVSRP